MFFHSNRFEPLCRDASCTWPERILHMAVPKVFIKRHLHSHLGGVIIPRFDYTLVYAKRGEILHTFNVNKKYWRNLWGKGVHEAKSYSQLLLPELTGFCWLRAVSDKTFGTAEWKFGAFSPRLNQPTTRTHLGLRDQQHAHKKRTPAGGDG